jgi:hypothetical protein
MMQIGIDSFAAAISDPATGLTLILIRFQDETNETNYVTMVACQDLVVQI